VSAPLTQRAAAKTGGQFRPLIIGVTGHRDLVPEDIGAIERQVRALLDELRGAFPGRPLRILSPLAEGADRLVALIAEEQGIELVVPMPMPESQYAKDFESSRSWAEFGRLTRYARETLVLPLAPGCTSASIADYGHDRNRQYAEAGAWVAAHSDVLLALWDGKTTGDLGGTGHVVQFRRTGTMPDYLPCFVERPNHDLVAHIVCARDRQYGEPADGLEPATLRWLTRREEPWPALPGHSVEKINRLAPEGGGDGTARASVIEDSYRFPLVVGVTGHRDLRADELPGIRQRVRALFLELRERYPLRKLRLLTPLAEGADRLVAEEALALDVEIRVVLPMPRDLYYADFGSESSIAEFNALYRRASDVLTLPLARNHPLDAIREPGPARDLQYAQAGVFLSAHCHILLALWDGKMSGKLGGTAQVVRFHHHDIMPGYSTRSVATQQMLIDDESDLIYHVVCSREGPDGVPAEPFEPLECWWYTNDRHAPRTPELPRQHELVFRRSSEFSEDATRFKARIADESYPLYDADADASLPTGLASVNHLFCISDWLAIHYQKLTMMTLRSTHVLAFLMGIMFILYSDVGTQEIYIGAFLLFFLLAAGLQRFAVERGWQRKYLDYRALAEGLRVQFYLTAAGITSDNESKFTHDNFLQTQDPELGWIRNVMRVAGTRADAERVVTPAGLEFAIREWIGDDASGQLGYYKRKAAQWVRRNRATERLSMLSLVTSVVVVLVILAAGRTLGDDIVDPLFAFMGMILLAYAVRQGFAQSTAEKELIKQYEFMLRVFENAERRLANADDDAERRQIIRALGGSCLDEHAEWILMHRDRSIDQGDIWRIGS